MLKVYRKIANTLSKNQYQRFLPLNHSSADIYFCSYPKSGNTWLRFLIANTLKVHFSVEREVNFFTIQDIIPDIHLGRNVPPQGAFGLAMLPRLIKSHAPYNPYYCRAIVLSRDPRDVMKSYFLYAKSIGRIPDDYTFYSFIRNPRFGVSRWESYTKSWFLNNKGGQNIQFLSYEKLLLDTEGELNRLMSILGLNVDSLCLQEAIRLSSKENMRKAEILSRSTNLTSKNKTPFVREGKSTLGLDMTFEDRSYIERIARESASLCGYDF